LPEKENTKEINGMNEIFYETVKEISCGKVASYGTLAVSVSDKKITQNTNSSVHHTK